MTFPTVVFGSGIVTTPDTITYVDGGSILAGGYRLFIVPIKNVGGAGIDIRFSYINQFGQAKTTAITTAVAPFTTAGTHTQSVLEPGDVGIRDLTGVTIVGGTAGDELSFESWNEGSGSPAKPIISTTTFDRTIPGTRLDEPLFARAINMKLIDRIGLIPIFYSSPNPIIQVPTSLSISMFISRLPEPIVDRSILSRIFIAKLGNKVDWSSDPYDVRTFPGRGIQDLRSWLESVVGQVTSGYIQNINGETIKSAFTMILMSSPTLDVPAGVTTTTTVNPSTGLYQAFLKKVVYDKRYTIIKIGLKNIALEGAGIPIVVDGNQTLPSPYNLQFACPIINCDFNITRKV